MVFVKDSRHLLDDKLRETHTSDCRNSNEDLPKWFADMAVFAIFCLPFFTILLSNPLYLTSQISYPYGSEIYSTLNEVLHFKDQISNHSTNLWFDSESLGYPMFLSNEPLPCVATAFLIILLERFFSPLCIFRLVIVLLISLVPVALYKGARGMMLSRAHSVILALLVFIVQSKHRSGYELDSVFFHGSFNQLFGLVLLPLAVSKLFTVGMRLGKQDWIVSVFYLCLTYCCHITAGVFCSMVDIVTFVTFIFTKEFSTFYMKSAAKRHLAIHLNVLIYLSWWVIPNIISFPYAACGGSLMEFINPMRFSSMFISGKIFDEKRDFIWLTVNVAVGLSLISKNMFKVLFGEKPLLSNFTQRLSFWLIMLTLSTVLFFASFYSTPALFPLHFCGIFAASFSFDYVIGFISSYSASYKTNNRIRILLILCFGIFCMSQSIIRISDRLLVVEVDPKFELELKNVRMDKQSGRILLHEKLGTGSSWDLHNIPKITGKQGVFSYDKRQRSTSYLDALSYIDITSKHFSTYTQLFNIQFLVGTTQYIDEDTEFHSELESVMKFDDLQIFEISQNEEKYGMFDFISLPGYVDGNSKSIQQAVLQSLELYSQHVLLYINPRSDARVRKDCYVDIQATKFPHSASYFQDLSIVNWKVNGKEVASSEAIGKINDIFSKVWIHSVVIEEYHTSNEYHALVDVVQNVEQVKFREHLLLKVSFHPFWRCSAFSVPHSYALVDYDPSALTSEARVVFTIDHVTPNMMAVTLPPGKYHVIFQYRFPGILKIIALICLLVLLEKFFSLMNVMVTCINTLRCLLRKLMLYFKFIFVFNRTFSYCAISEYLKFLFSFLPTISLNENLPYLSAFHSIRCIPIVSKSVTALFRLPIVSKSVALFSKARLILKDLTVGLVCEKNPSFLVLNEKLSSGNLHSDVKYDSFISSDSINDTQRFSLNTINSDKDSTFDDLRRKSPLLKHCKKSSRKRHSHILNQSADVSDFSVFDDCVEEEFKSASKSPRLNNILNTLRKSSLEMRRNALEKVSIAPPCNVSFSPSPTTRRVFLESYHLSRNISHDVNDVEGKKRSYKSSNAETGLESDIQKKTNVEYMTSFNNNNIKSTDSFEDENEISHSLEESFSPIHSSSPDYSLSPETFSSGESASDCSFEYKHQYREAVDQNDVFQTNKNQPISRRRDAVQYNHIFQRGKFNIK